MGSVGHGKMLSEKSRPY